ncbi:MAG: ADP-ribosylglycohydrolase family protein, partial [Promethearchaeota archaeon]
LKEVYTSLAMNLSLEAGLIKFSQIGVKKPYFIEEFMGKAFVHPYAMSTVACALFIFLSYKNSFKECFYKLATAGGDTDTVAAIGGSLMGAYMGFNEIPADLINLIRDKKKILKIADELHAKYCQKYSPNDDNIQSLCD